MEALLDYDKQFYNPDLKELNVIDKNYGAKETWKIKMSPAIIICILSKEKSRSKNIYLFEKTWNQLFALSTIIKSSTLKSYVNTLTP